MWPSDNLSERDFKIACTHGSCAERGVIFHVIQAAITFFILSSNIVVIVSLARDKFFGEMKYWFIASLSAADLAVGIVLVYYHTIDSLGKVSNALCATFSSLLSSTIFCSALNLIAVTFNTFLVIVHPLHYHGIMTPSRAKRILVFTWALGAAWLAMSMLYGWNDLETTYPVCSQVFIMKFRYWVLFSVFCIFVPGLIITVLYWQIFAVARRHAQNIRAHGHFRSGGKRHLSRVLPVQDGCSVTVNCVQINAPKQPVCFKREMKTAGMIALIIGSFIIGWGLYVGTILLMRVRLAFYNKSILTFLGFIGVTNCFTNVIFYAWRSKRLRKAFRHSLFLSAKKLLAGKHKNAHV